MGAPHAARKDDGFKGVEQDHENDQRAGSDCGDVHGWMRSVGLGNGSRCASCA